MSKNRMEQDGIEFLQTFRRGLEFTEELMAENVRLRERVADLDSQLARKSGASESGEGEDRSRRNSMELENQDYARRHVEIDAEYDRLAKLYVTSYQLHTSLDAGQVLRVASEILRNIIGAGDFAFYLKIDSNLTAVSSETRTMDAFPSFAAEHPICQAIDAGEIWLDDGGGAGESGNPLVAIPVQLGGVGLGMFAVFSLLEQKECITELDKELFRLLGTHASSALMAAMWHAKSGDGQDLLEGLVGQMNSASSDDGKAT